MREHPLTFINKKALYLDTHYCYLKIQQTRTYLARKYDICRQTVSKLLAEKCGITHSGHLTPLELELFIQKVGTPEQFKRALKMLTE